MDLFYDRKVKIYKNKLITVDGTQKKTFVFEKEIDCDYRNQNTRNLEWWTVYRDKDYRRKQLDVEINSWINLGDQVVLFTSWINEWTYKVIDRETFNDPFLNLNNVLFTIKNVDG